MENVKYIPGDLVKSDNNPNIQWRIVDVFTNEKGDALYRVRAVEDSDVIAYLWEKQIVPIPLAFRILEANGWLEIENTEYIHCYQHPHMGLLQVHYRKVDKIWCAYLHDEYLVQFNSVHELQHLLFAFNLSMDLKM